MKIMRKDYPNGTWIEVDIKKDNLKVTASFLSGSSIKTLKEIEILVTEAEIIDKEVSTEVLFLQNAGFKSK